VLRKPFMQRDIPVARGMASMLATASLPLLLSDIMSELRRNFEVLLLGYFASTADVGIFGAAVIIGQLINVPIMALERIFVPVAALLYARQQSHDVHKLYRTSARWILYSITPVLVAIILYSDTIVTSVLGVQYSAAAPVLQILAVGYFVNGLTGLWEQVLLAKGHNVVTMVLRIVWVVTSLVLAFILVPRYGYIGAAWSATIPLILIQLQGVYTVWWLEKTHPFSVQEFRYTAGTVLVFLVFYVLSQNVDVVRQHTAVFLAMACVVAYGVSLLFAGLTPDDRFLLSMLSSRLRKDQSLT
jgi:O-antigen/teichoic acid export membrane protein